VDIPRHWQVLGTLTGIAMVSAVGVNQGIKRLVAEPEVAVDAATGELVAGDPASGLVPAAGGPEGEGQDARQARIAARIDIPRSEDQYREAILERNIFDSSKAGGKPKEKAEDDGGPAGPVDLNVTLKATWVAEPAAYSAAFFLKEGDGYARAYGIGQEISGAKILAIEEGKVKILRNGIEEWVSIGGAKVAAEKPAAAAEGTPVAEGVEQISETEFNVDKSLIESNLNDLEGLSKLGRALLHRGPDGEYDGYRLSAIRRGSLADQLGIRNGDIVHMVNGTPLDSVQGAMQAFQGLTGGLAPGGAFKFEVTRRGQPMTLNYNVK
jgi:type II secretory pathway component PulC